MADAQVSTGRRISSIWIVPIVALLLGLLREGPDGRTGHNLGCWVGRPLSLEDSIEVGHRR